MLKRLKFNSLEDLTNNVLPRSIRRTKPFELPGETDDKGEHEVLSDLRKIMDKNQVSSNSYRYIKQSSNLLSDI